MTTNTKVILIATGTTAILVAGALYYSHEPPLPPFGAEIKQELKLKCDKSKILESKEVDWIEQVLDEQGSWTIINHGKIIKYDYITKNKATGNFIWHKGKYTNARISTTKANTTDFFVGDHFAKADNGDIYEIEHGATTTIEAFKEQTKPDLISRIKGLFTAQAVDYYVGAGDGNVSRGNEASWAAAHDTAAGEVVSVTGTTVSNGCWRDASTFDIYRAFFPADTSALPDDATISAASLFLYLHSVIGNNDNDGDDYINIVETFQADETTLVLADYEDCGSDNGTAARAYTTPIEVGSTALDITGLTAEYKEFVLDATGRGWISKVGYTKIGAREGHDLLNSALAGSGWNGVGWRTSEYADTTSDPYLSVTYTVPAVAPIDSTQVIIWED